MYRRPPDYIHLTLHERYVPARDCHGRYEGGKEWVLGGSWLCPLLFLLLLATTSCQGDRALSDVSSSCEHLLPARPPSLSLPPTSLHPSLIPACPSLSLSLYMPPSSCTVTLPPSVSPCHPQSSLAPLYHCSLPPFLYSFKTPANSLSCTASVSYILRPVCIIPFFIALLLLSSFFLPYPASSHPSISFKYSSPIHPALRSYFFLSPSIRSFFVFLLIYFNNFLLFFRFLLSYQPYCHSSLLLSAFIICSLISLSFHFHIRCQLIPNTLMNCYPNYLSSLSLILRIKSY